ncbi:MAG: VOC family protein [Alphaproteobacteria bacterium]|nr:VOC family protein [Alphaproteobacteria bacterium]
MSGRPIDHIVLAVRSLETAAQTYEGLGFTLTPRAFHEDRMGTSNRLAQFAGQNFIELLEVDRPDLLAPHDFQQTPPFFSFGDHNKSTTRDAMTMLVFAGDDARADIAAFAKADVPTYAPFDFDRQATLPNGQQVTVSFSLGFATSPDMPDLAFFVCQNRAPDYFWKPAFQNHANGAQSITAIYLASDNPARDAAFIGKLFEGEITPVDGGLSVACGPQQAVHVLTPDTIAALDPSFQVDSYANPAFAGIEISAPAARTTVPSTAAHGVFIARAVRGA